MNNAKEKPNIQRHSIVKERKTQCNQDVSSCQLFYRVNIIPIKIPASCFVTMNKPILKLQWRNRRPRIASSVLKKNEAREAKSVTEGITGPAHLAVMSQRKSDDNVNLPLVMFQPKNCLSCVCKVVKYTRQLGLYGSVYQKKHVYALQRTCLFIMAKFGGWVLLCHKRRERENQNVIQEHLSVKKNY